ncbi:MAG: hypothetical protein PVF83_13410 [Anaerolineales bacterium]
MGHPARRLGLEEYLALCPSGELALSHLTANLLFTFLQRAILCDQFAHTPRYKVPIRHSFIAFDRRGPESRHPRQWGLGDAAIPQRY